MNLIIPLVFLVSTCKAASVLSFSDSQDTFDTSDSAPSSSSYDFGRRTVPVRALLYNQGPIYSQFGGARRLSDDSDPNPDEPAQDEAPAVEEPEEDSNKDQNPFGEPPHSKRRLSKPSESDSAEEDQPEQPQQPEEDEKPSEEPNKQGDEEIPEIPEVPQEASPEELLKPGSFYTWSNPWSFQHPWYPFVSQNTPGVSYISSQGSTGSPQQSHVSYISQSHVKPQPHQGTQNVLLQQPITTQQQQLSPTNWYIQPHTLQNNGWPNVQSSSVFQTTVPQTVISVPHYSQKTINVPSSHSYVVSQSHSPSQKQYVVPSVQLHNSAAPVAHTATQQQHVIPAIQLHQSVSPVHTSTQQNVVPSVQLIHSAAPSVHTSGQKHVVPTIQLHNSASPVVHTSTQQQIVPTVQLHNSAVPAVHTSSQIYQPTHQQAVIQPQVPAQWYVASHIQQSEYQPAVQSHQVVQPVVQSYQVSKPSVQLSYAQTPLLNTLFNSYIPSKMEHSSKPVVQAQTAHQFSSEYPAVVHQQPQLSYSSWQIPSGVSVQNYQSGAGQSVPVVQQAASWPVTYSSWAPDSQTWNQPWNQNWNQQVTPWNNQWLASQGSAPPQAWSYYTKQ